MCGCSRFVVISEDFVSKRKERERDIRTIDRDHVTIGDRDKTADRFFADAQPELGIKIDDAIDAVSVFRGQTNRLSRLYQACI